MTLHFVKLQLGDKAYRTKVSTEGCSDVDDFLRAIRASPQLPIGNGIITLFQPDGTTEIDPETPVTDLKEIPWKPMVVTVDELPIPGPTGSSKKQLSYKGMSTEASCRKYLDALARQLALYYDFKWGKDDEKRNGYPTFGDVLFAKRKKKWSYRYDEVLATDEEGFTPVTPKKIPKLDIPLPDLFSADEWKRLDELNDSTNERIHDADIPKSHGKSFVIVPENDYNQETIDFIKSVAVKAKLFTDEKKLDVKNESYLSGSSSSESGSPDKKKM
jgi:hypothetical protein